MGKRTTDIFALNKSQLRSNAKFRALTPSNKWYWIETFLFLDDQEERGVCRWDLDRIARAIGAPIEALKSIAKDDVLKGAHEGVMCEPYIHVDRRGEEHTLIPAQCGPIWYSSAIVREEYLRAVASNSGRRGGGNPALRINNAVVDDTYIGATKGVVKGATKGVGDGVSPAPLSLPVPLSLTSPTSPDLFPREEKPDSPRKTRKQSDSPHAELIRFFIDAWQAKYAKPYPFRKLDAMKMAELLKACGGAMEDAKAVLLRYLACPDGFVNGHPLSLLMSGSLLPKFLVEPSKTGVSNGNRSQFRNGPRPVAAARGEFPEPVRVLPEL